MRTAQRAGDPFHERCQVLKFGFTPSKNEHRKCCSFPRSLFSASQWTT